MGVVGAASSRMVAWTPVARPQKRVQHSLRDMKLEEGVREGAGRFHLVLAPAQQA